MRLILANNGVSVQPFDQDVWAETFAYAKRDPAASLEAFRVLRENNLAMLKALPKNLWENYGMHQERGKETITHIVRMFAGHDLNHAGASREYQEKKPKQARSLSCIVRSRVDAVAVALGLILLRKRAAYGSNTSTLMVVQWAVV